MPREPFAINGHRNVDAIVGKTRKASITAIPTTSPSDEGEGVEALLLRVSSFRTDDEAHQDAARSRAFLLSFCLPAFQSRKPGKSEAPSLSSRRAGQTHRRAEPPAHLCAPRARSMS